MKFLMLVVCLLAVKADGITDDIYIDGVPHRAEVLYNFISNFSFYSLAVDYEYNYLYLVDGARRAQPVILNLNTKELKSYLGHVQMVRSLSVDQETHDLYIGANEGIFKYNTSSGEEQLLGATDVTVAYVYFNGILYYTNFWTERVATLINGQSDVLATIQTRLHRFVIDNEDVMFFTNSSGLYSRHMNSNHTTLYYNKSYVTCPALNRNGTVYFTSDDGIYEIIKYNASYRQVVSIKQPEEIAFDKNNNIIYCDKHKVYRLKPKTE